MSELAEPHEEPSAPRSRTKILVSGMLIVASGLGFASTYFDVVNPLELLKNRGMPAVTEGPDFVFLDVPQVVLTLAGARPRTLVLSAKIELEPDSVENVKYLMPRILDSLNVFLSDIDPVALERRGVLDVIRSELSTRVKYIVGDDSIRDILITEFRIQ